MSVRWPERDTLEYERETRGGDDSDEYNARERYTGTPGGDRSGDERDRAPAARGREIDDEGAMSQDERSERSGSRGRRRMDRDPSRTPPRRRSPDRSLSPPGRRRSSGGESRSPSPREGEQKYQDYDDREDSPISVMTGVPGGGGRDGDTYGNREQETYGGSGNRKTRRKYSADNVIAMLDQLEKPPSPNSKNRRGSIDEPYTNRRQRKFSTESTDSVASFDSRTGRHKSRRFSQAEARLIRRAKEKEDERSRAEEKRMKARQRRDSYAQNRKKVKEFDQGKREDDSDVDPSPTSLNEGDVVYVNRCYGTVQYVGPLEGRPHDETAIGIEFLNKKGNSNGSHKGKRYFDCDDGYGFFTTAVDKRISSQRLLQVVNTKQSTIKEQETQIRKLKRMLSKKNREKTETSVLKERIAEMAAQIRSLKKGNVRQFESAMSNSMESFLNILTEGMNGDDDDETPGNRTNALNIPEGALPDTNNEAKIMRWVVDKKAAQRRGPKDHPKYMNKDVQASLIWLVRTMSRECRRNTFSDDE